MVKLFVAAIPLSFVLWFDVYTLYNKTGYQLNIFFLRTGNFLADFTNVVGYSAGRDPHNSLAYAGLSEKAYLPLCYVIMYVFPEL